MTLVTKRRVRRMGGSCKFSIPMEWVKQNRIKGGMDLQVISDEVVIILPPRDYTGADIDDIFNRMCQLAKAVVVK